MTAIRSKMVEGGRILVPATIRRAMKLEKGDTVLLELHGEELRVRFRRRGSATAPGVLAGEDSARRVAGRGADRRSPGGSGG